MNAGVSVRAGLTADLHGGPMPLGPGEDGNQRAN